jgi:hypothetical protein
VLARRLATGDDDAAPDGATEQSIDKLSHSAILLSYTRRRTLNQPQLVLLLYDGAAGAALTAVGEHPFAPDGALRLEAVPKRAERDYY